MKGLEGAVGVISNDPNLPFMEIQYTKREDAESALTYNNKVYSLNNVNFVINVRLKDHNVNLNGQSAIGINHIPEINNMD